MLTLAERVVGAKEITLDGFMSLLAAARELFSEEPNVVRARAALTIVGGICGCFDGFVKLLEQVGIPPDRPILFTGNIMDGGGGSLECLVFALQLKVDYPDGVWIIRGQNESAEEICKEGGLRSELVKRGGAPGDVQRVCELLYRVFDAMPWAAVVGERIFCVSGGIGPGLTLGDIERADRRRGRPERGPLRALFWGEPRLDRDVDDAFLNEDVQEFLERHELQLMVRGWQAVAQGYEFPFHPDCGVVNLWSAPNYGGWKNDGAVMLVGALLDCSFKVVRADDFGSLTPGGVPCWCAELPHVVSEPSWGGDGGRWAGAFAREVAEGPPLE